MCVYSISKHDERAIIWAHLSLNMHYNRRQQQQQQQRTPRRRQKKMRWNCYASLFALLCFYRCLLFLNSKMIVLWLCFHGACVTILYLFVFVFVFVLANREKKNEFSAWFNCKVVDCDPVFFFFSMVQQFLKTINNEMVR